MENPVKAVSKNMAVRAAIPVTLGVLAAAYLIISAYTKTLNPMKWSSNAKGGSDASAT